MTESDKRNLVAQRLPVFTDSGTYAPTFLVGSWRDEAQATHVFLCDGYAATAEAMQAASLSDVLDVHATMTMFSPSFDLPCECGWAARRQPPSTVVAGCRTGGCPRCARPKRRRRDAS
ncbi:MAG: hypothetical protein AAB418_07205 [candidate division NC10 bacterium]